MIFQGILAHGCQVTHSQALATELVTNRCVPPRMTATRHGRGSPVPHWGDSERGEPDWGTPRGERLKGKTSGREPNGESQVGERTGRREPGHACCEASRATDETDHRSGEKPVRWVASRGRCGVCDAMAEWSLVPCLESDGGFPLLISTDSPAGWSCQLGLTDRGGSNVD